MEELTISFKIENPPAWISIGRTAENNWRTIEIDCSYWFNMDATGNVVLMYRPSCGMAAYPLLIERDGDNIVWHPKSGELVEGVGQMQAFFYVGESKIGSSEMVSCEVDGSLLGGDPGTDPGAVAPPWAIDIIEQIAELSGHYPKIENGVLFIWDSEREDWVQFQGGGGNPNAVLYTQQSLTDAQKSQARTNVGAGTYSKPSGGIPASDLAPGVIPSVPQMATAADMSDWTSGKTVDAAVLKADFIAVAGDLDDLSVNKADKSEIPSLTGYATETWVDGKGYQTAQEVQATVNTALDAKADKSTLVNLLIPILRQGLYGADQEAAISALETALGGTPPVQTFVITNNLTNVTNSNEATAVNSGTAYTATLTPAEGMEIQTVTVTMGGSDITSTAYSNGAITIASVTGDVVITAVAESIIETYTPTMIAGYYILPNGREYDHSSYTRTPVIPCREGDKVYGTCENSSYPGSTVNYIRARWTAAYDNNSNAIESAGSSDQKDYSQSSPYVVPSGVYGVVFSMVNALANNVVIYVDKSERVGA